MKPKRLFQVYPERPRSLSEAVKTQSWRWRLIAPRNGQIVGGSHEAFDSKGNALRAARREASLYPDGVAAVEAAS